MAPSPLEIGDAEAAAVAVAPRVSLASMEAKIVAEYWFTASDAVAGLQGGAVPLCEELKTLTICVLVLNNGWTLVGKSAPAAPANFNAELGRKFAREDAIRQLWPLEGYALRERLAKETAR